MKESLNFIFLLLLLVAGICDLKYKKISLSLLVIGMILCGIKLFSTTNPDLAGCFTGTMTGVCLLFVSGISKESIGYGDGILVTELGFILGFQAGLEIVFVSFWLMLPLSCFIFLRKLLKSEMITKSIRLPYIPFLMISYSFWLFHVQEFISEKITLLQGFFVSNTF